jgi:hypothetical protein
MEDGRRIDVGDVDARVYAVWAALDRDGLPEAGHDRDLTLFLAGVKAVCFAFGPDPGVGDNLGDHIAAGVSIREVIAARIDAAEAEREGGPA